MMMMQVPTSVSGAEKRTILAKQYVSKPRKKKQKLKIK